MTLAAQALVEDRRTGTLERLMTTRLGVNQLFLGKLLSGVLRATFQTVLMLSLAFVVFRPLAPWPTWSCWPSRCWRLRHSPASPWS